MISIQEIIESIDVEKIRNDVLIYLNTHESIEKTESNSYTTWALHTITGIEKKVFIRDFSNLEILSIKVSKVYNEKGYSLYQSVKIGLGLIIHKKTSYKIGTCILELLYDEDFILITIDFFFDPILNFE